MSFLYKLILLCFLSVCDGSYSDSRKIGDLYQQFITRAGYLRTHSIRKPNGQLNTSSLFLSAAQDFTYSDPNKIVRERHTANQVHRIHGDSIQVGGIWYTRHVYQDDMSKRYYRREMEKYPITALRNDKLLQITLPTFICLVLVVVLVMSGLCDNLAYLLFTEKMLRIESLIVQQERAN